MITEGAEITVSEEHRGAATGAGLGGVTGAVAVAVLLPNDAKKRKVPGDHYNQISRRQGLAGEFICR